MALSKRTLIIICAILATTSASQESHNTKNLLNRDLGNFSRRVSKAGKAGAPPAHHGHHGHHSAPAPAHLDKSGKMSGKAGKTSGKSGKAVEHLPIVAPEDDDNHAHDDGYHYEAGDDDNVMSVGMNLTEEVESRSGDGHYDDDDDDWTGDGHHHAGKSGKGHKSAKSAKTAKSGKTGGKGSKSQDHDDGWHSDDHDDGWQPGWHPTPAPTPCGKAGKECEPKVSLFFILHEHELNSTMNLTQLSVLAPKTLPPVCGVVPCSIDGVVVSPPTMGGAGMITQPPQATPIVGIITQPPQTAPVGMPSPAVPPPTPMVPITVAPVDSAESGYPTWTPTSTPTSTIQSLSTSGSWFQTGKAYEVDSYTRARQHDEQMGFSFAQKGDTSGSESFRRLSLVGVYGVMGIAIVFQMLG